VTTLVYRSSLGWREAPAADYWLIVDEYHSTDLTLWFDEPSSLTATPIRALKNIVLPIAIAASLAGLPGAGGVRRGFKVSDATQLVRPGWPVDEDVWQPPGWGLPAIQDVERWPRPSPRRTTSQSARALERATRQDPQPQMPPLDISDGLGP
jgi:hypothetical protein